MRMYRVTCWNGTPTGCPNCTEGAEKVRGAVEMHDEAPGKGLILIDQAWMFFSLVIIICDHL